RHGRARHGPARLRRRAQSPDARAAHRRHESQELHTMCGIAGFVESSAAAAPLGAAEGRALVQRLGGVIRHRGPDDEGSWGHEGVGRGMRRLSIIDLSTGHQPIRNEDGSVWVVFNGEIYNFRELRRELEERGHRFYTSTDSETIVHAYEEWGRRAIGRLRGM